MTYAFLEIILHQSNTETTGILTSQSYSSEFVDKSLQTSKTLLQLLKYMKNKELFPSKKDKALLVI